ncbi:MAG: redox-regulated ATPase YchF [Spirochaetales bacterium]|nr:redox-regulated ATPase YchF [Spirochaetales bacterium]
MNIGIIGLEKSGKTTIYNAITGFNVSLDMYNETKKEPNIALVDVPDTRIEILAQIYQPQKVTYGKIGFLDFTGLKSSDTGKGLFSSASMELIKNCDALALVLRNFSNEILDATISPPDPLKDMEVIRSELVLSDLVIIEKRLERIQADIRRGKSTPVLLKEQKLLEKIDEVLTADDSIHSLGFNPEERKMLSGFRFLTLKPLFIILNSDEQSYNKNNELIQTIEQTSHVIEFAGNVEMELSLLEPEESKEFMDHMGIPESARQRLITFAFDLLGYMSFFTVGKDEVRAWTIKKGDTALDAAGVIHSDLARGFIRAECFSFDSLIEYSSEEGVRKNGKWRLEGKEYIVQNGDILSIRFSV